MPGSGLEFTAPVRGTYLLDVYSTGATGDYRFTWTVQNAAGLPIEVTAPACSPNGDGVQDSCAWTAGAIAGWTITSFVTRGAARVARLSGPGEQAWDGRGAAAGAYRLRVQYAEPGSGRVLESDAQKAGRQRLAWTGQTATGAWLRGRFSYVIEASDAAGNTARSGRHTVRVL